MCVITSLPCSTVQPWKKQMTIMAQFFVYSWSLTSTCCSITSYVCFVCARCPWLSVTLLGLLAVREDSGSGSSKVSTLLDPLPQWMIFSGALTSFWALTLLVGWQERQPALFLVFFWDICHRNKWRQKTNGDGPTLIHLENDSYNVDGGDGCVAWSLVTMSGYCVHIYVTYTSKLISF